MISKIIIICICVFTAIGVGVVYDEIKYIHEHLHTIHEIGEHKHMDEGPPIVDIDIRFNKR